MYEQDYLDFLSLPAKLYNKIEENVVDLLVQLNIRSYPVDPMQIALSLGYELVPFFKMDTEMRWLERMIPFSAMHSSVGTSMIISSMGHAVYGTTVNSCCERFGISPVRSRRISPPIRISRSRSRFTMYIG